MASAVSAAGACVVAVDSTGLSHIVYRDISAGELRYIIVDGASTPVTQTITVTAVNDAPENTVPGDQTTDEDTALVFSATGGNAITVADVDATTLEVTISVGSGTLTLGPMPRKPHTLIDAR